MRLRRKIIIALGAALGMAILIPCLWHWQLRATNEAYLAKLAAQGEPLTLAQVVPPAVPPAENSAEVFLRAAALLAADASFLQTNDCCAMLAVGPGKAVVSSQQPEALGYESTNSWADVVAALARNQPALDLLQKVTGHPALDFHINYQKGLGNGSDFTNLHLIELKKSGRYLATAAFAALHEGDLTTAVRNQRAVLALVYAMQRQRYVISELVGIAMLGNAQRINWEILQTPGITEAQLAGLQNDWERINYIQGGCGALAMERATGEITLDQWRRSSAKVRHYLEMEEMIREKMGNPDGPASFREKAGTFAQTLLWQYWWSYPDELRTLQGYEVLLGTSRFLETNECFQMAMQNQQARLQELQITNVPDDIVSLTYSFGVVDDFRSLMSHSILSLAGTTKRLMIAETARQMTIAAIALQRYKLSHGHYPNHLSGLVPEFLAAIPPDPVDGQPLRYHRQADGTFLLYSVGENGVDDGGDPSPADHGTPKTFYWQSPGALDWVWPQATTADGIQFIYTNSR